MTYDDTWNSAFEAVPGDGEYQDVYPGEARDFRKAVRQRIAKDHYMDIAGTDADHGEHQKITFQSQIADPTNVANKGFLYIKDVSAKAELFWQDEDGNVLQLTGGGGLCAFPSGTKMWFYQNTAPTGWTIVTGVGDRLIGVSDGTTKFDAAGTPTDGGAAGGNWDQGNHTHSVSGTTAAAAGFWQIPSGSLWQYCSGYLHTHIFSTTSGGNKTPSTWRPAAAVGIICSKD